MQFAILFGLNTIVFNYIGFLTKLAKVPDVAREIKKNEFKKK